MILDEYSFFFCVSSLCPCEFSRVYQLEPVVYILQSYAVAAAVFFLPFGEIAVPYVAGNVFIVGLNVDVYVAWAYGADTMFESVLYE